MSVLRQVQAIVLLPGVVTVGVPALLVAQAGGIRLGWGLAAPLQWLLTGLGVGLAGLGVFLLAQTIALFAARGKGTLAPWTPTQRLVAAGVYRRVRNPMISGVFGILLGEAALCGRPALLAWAVIFIAINMVYIPLVEEPGLERRFGEDYREYKRHVPRWLPRLRPWEG